MCSFGNTLPHLNRFSLYSSPPSLWAQSTVGIPSQASAYLGPARDTSTGQEGRSAGIVGGDSTCVCLSGCEFVLFVHFLFVHCATPTMVWLFMSWTGSNQPVFSRQQPHVHCWCLFSPWLSLILTNNEQFLAIRTRHRIIQRTSIQVEANTWNSGDGWP